MTRYAATLHNFLGSPVQFAGYWRVDRILFCTVGEPFCYLNPLYR